MQFTPHTIELFFSTCLLNRVPYQAQPILNLALFGTRQIIVGYLVRIEFTEVLKVLWAVPVIFFFFTWETKRTDFKIEIHPLEILSSVKTNHLLVIANDKHYRNVNTGKRIDESVTYTSGWQNQSGLQIQIFILIVSRRNPKSHMDSKSCSFEHSINTR